MDPSFDPLSAAWGTFAHVTMLKQKNTLICVQLKCDFAFVLFAECSRFYDVKFGAKTCSPFGKKLFDQNKKKQAKGASLVALIGLLVWNCLLVPSFDVSWVVLGVQVNDSCNSHIVSCCNNSTGPCCPLNLLS